jgi:hypothetical protein
MKIGAHLGAGSVKWWVEFCSNNYSIASLIWQQQHTNWSLFLPVATTTSFEGRMSLLGFFIGS